MTVWLSANEWTNYFIYKIFKTLNLHFFTMNDWSIVQSHVECFLPITVRSSLTKSEWKKLVDKLHCQLCGQIFRTASGRLVHLRRVHGQPDPINFKASSYYMYKEGLSYMRGRGRGRGGGRGRGRNQSCIGAHETIPTSGISLNIDEIDTDDLLVSDSDDDDDSVLVRMKEFHATNSSLGHDLRRKKSDADSENEYVAAEDPCCITISNKEIATLGWDTRSVFQPKVLMKKIKAVKYTHPDGEAHWHTYSSLLSNSTPEEISLVSESDSDSPEVMALDQHSQPSSSPFRQSLVAQSTYSEYDAEENLPRPDSALLETFLPEADPVPESDPLAEAAMGGLCPDPEDTAENRRARSLVLNSDLDDDDDDAANDDIQFEYQTTNTINSIGLDDDAKVGQHAETEDDSNDSYANIDDILRSDDDDDDGRRSEEVRRDRDRRDPADEDEGCQIMRTRSDAAGDRSNQDIFMEEEEDGSSDIEIIADGGASRSEVENFDFEELGGDCNEDDLHPSDQSTFSSQSSVNVRRSHNRQKDQSTEDQPRTSSAKPPSSVRRRRLEKPKTWSKHIYAMYNKRKSSGSSLVDSSLRSFPVVDQLIDGNSSRPWRLDRRKEHNLNGTDLNDVAAFDEINGFIVDEEGLDRAEDQPHEVVVDVVDSEEEQNDDISLC